MASFLSELMGIMPDLLAHHAPDDPVHLFFKKLARSHVDALIKPSSTLKSIDLGPFGKIVFPYHQMGVASTVNLFDLDELIIFSFYWQNRKRYKNVADIGANQGLHAVLLNRCGFHVQAYEPDPKHYKILNENLKRNHCRRAVTYNSAVSDKAGVREFIRVLGNTTGSHVAGSKENPYGKLQRFYVKTEPIKEIIQWADLLKIDAEGHEADILLATKSSDWLKTEAMVEVQNEKNARRIFKHFSKMNVNLFSQKTNWQRVFSMKEMPTTYKEGSLFISKASKMPYSL